MRRRTTTIERGLSRNSHLRSEEERDERQRIRLGLPHLALNVSIVRAADWPQWRGPDRSCISTENDWIWNWPKQGPRPSWNVNVGPGYSAVSVSAERVYTMGYEGRGRETQKELVICLDLRKQ
jgi:hypothetical protein